MRFLYALAWLATLPFALLYLLWRARRQPEYLRHWAERLGRGPAPGQRFRVVVHAVSVGETRAAEPLVEALLARHPAWEVLLTHATPTGRAAGRERFGERVGQAYLPYDFAPCVARFLSRCRPSLVIILETEVWPGLYHACARRGIPVFLVNARLSERSWRGYRRVRPLVAPALAELAGLAAQTAADARRLADLGGRNVRVMGNLKFDVKPPAGWEATAAALRARLAGRFVFLAASTREGEEAPLLDLLARPELAGMLLLLVPRHPQRFAEVARLIEARGLAWGRRSDLEAIPAGARVVLGDSMGEMAAYYAAAELAYIGGSLLPFGGQNLIEAAALGCPALVGPHTWNFAEAAERAVEAGAARRVADLDDLARALAELRADAPARAAMAEAGRGFARDNQGATERVLELVEPALAAVEQRT